MKIERKKWRMDGRKKTEDHLRPKDFFFLFLSIVFNQFFSCFFPFLFCFILFFPFSLLLLANPPLPINSNLKKLTIVPLYPSQNATTANVTVTFCDKKNPRLLCFTHECYLVRCIRTETFLPSSVVLSALLLIIQVQFRSISSEQKRKAGRQERRFLLLLWQSSARAVYFLAPPNRVIGYFGV